MINSQINLVAVMTQNNKKIIILIQLKMMLKIAIIIKSLIFTRKKVVHRLVLKVHLNKDLTLIQNLFH